MTSTRESSDTIAQLRALAARTTGDLLFELAQLEDRVDLPSAASELLHAGSEKERTIALLALREAADRGAEVARPAMAALCDPAPGIRIVAARALGVIGWRGARDALEAAVDDRDAEVRVHALLGLWELDAAAGIRRIGELLAGVRDARESALAALEQAKPDELPDELAALVEDPDLATRIRAIEIMAFSSASSPAPLFRALRDASSEVRLAAIDALTRKADVPPSDALPALLSEPDPEIRQRGMSLIARGRGPRHPASLDLLPYELPAEQATTLAVLGGAAAIPRLRAMLARAKSTAERELIWSAIGGIGESVGDGAMGAALLSDGLRDPDARVRVAAMNAAVWLRPQAVSLVAAHLRREPERRVRAAGLRTLARLLGGTAVGELRNALADPDEEVRCCAMDLLARIGTADDLPFIERVPASSPREQLARWQAQVRLSRGEAQLPEETRVLADPGHTGQLFTHWYEPGGFFGVTFTRAGMMLVFDDDDRVGNLSAFEAQADGSVRIGEQRCTLRLRRIRIHEAMRSEWGYSVLIKPDPWSAEPLRLLETLQWQAD